MESKTTTSENGGAKILTLPTTKTPRKTMLYEYTILLYGRPKIGKSTFLSNVDDIIFLAPDPGLNNIETYQVPINSWLELVEYGRLLLKEKHNFKAVAIDTLDSAYKMCVEYICKKHNINDPSEGKGFGGSWGLVNNEFMRVLMAFGRLPMGLFMTAHTKEITFKNKVGVETTYTVMNLPDTARKMVEGWIDIILHCDLQIVEGGKYKRIMKTSVNLDGTGSSRISIPDELPLDYDKFKEAFDAAISARNTTESVPAPTKASTLQTSKKAPVAQAQAPENVLPGIKLAGQVDYAQFIS